MQVPVEDCKDQGRNDCKCCIVQLNIEVVKDCQRAVATEVGEEELRHRQHTVFVEEIKDELRDGEIALSAVEEQETAQSFEFWNRKIGCLNSSETFVAKNTDPYMGFLYHGNVVRSISDC